MALIIFWVLFLSSFPGDPLLLFANTYKILTSKGSCYLCVRIHSRRDTEQGYGQIGKGNWDLRAQDHNCCDELLILILKAAKGCRITVFVPVFPGICSWMSLEARRLVRSEQLSKRRAPELFQTCNSVVFLCLSQEHILSVDLSVCLNLGCWPNREVTAIEL